MYASQNGATNLDSLATLSGPRLVHFYFFVCADKVIAEASAIETLAEAIRSRRLNLESSALVRLAAVKAVGLRSAGRNGDRIARGLLTLPPRQRIALALARGMGVSVEETAEAMGTNVAEAKRLLANAVLGIHDALFKEPDGKLENSSEI